MLGIIQDMHEGLHVRERTIRLVLVRGGSVEKTEGGSLQTEVFQYGFVQLCVVLENNFLFTSSSSKLRSNVYPMNQLILTEHYH